MQSTDVSGFFLNSEHNFDDMIHILKWNLPNNWEEKKNKLVLQQSKFLKLPTQKYSDLYPISITNLQFYACNHSTIMLGIHPKNQSCILFIKIFIFI